MDLKDLLRLQFSSLDELDAETIRRLEPVLNRAQVELRRELDKLPPSSFTYQQKRHTLLLINSALAKVMNKNISELYSMAEDTNQLAFEMANREVKELSGLSVPSVKKDKVSLKQNDFLLNTMQSSVESYTAGVRQKISNAITDATIQKKTGYETALRIGRYVDLSWGKIKRIQRTELSRIFNQTKLLTYGEFNKDNFKGTLRKRMFHPLDSRTAEDSKQWAQADPSIPLNKPFRLVVTIRQRGGKVKRIIQEGMTPPLRPNDRAVLMPDHRSWKE